jgi:chromosome partitioning protein
MHGNVIALANQKGGVGKTTTAINLAACLAEKRNRVLLIDLDPQANATSGLGVAPQQGGSVYEVLLGHGRLIEKVQPTAMERLFLIPSEVDLAGAEVDIARVDRYLHRFKEALEPLLALSHYDYVLVDCPPSMGILTMNALTAVHSVLIPLQCEYYALEGLSMITRLIGQIRQSGANPDLELDGIVMTMFDGRTNLAQQVVDEVRRHFGEKVYDSIIPRNIRISEAPSHGLPVVMYDGKSSGAESYRQFAKEFVKRRKAAAAPAPTPAASVPAPAAQPVPAAPAEAPAVTAPPAAPAPDAPPLPPADASTARPG